MNKDCKCEEFKNCVFSNAFNPQSFQFYSNTVSLVGIEYTQDDMWQNLFSCFPLKGVLAGEMHINRSIQALQPILAKGKDSDPVLVVHQYTGAFAILNIGTILNITGKNEPSL